ncbi:hypothetical protein SY89_00497 [Halolamina pelagica]|uniref:DUF7345 domain-containing protein n=1 Tax=Halolamina pelagica TaxID=699431 RepID=A0A0N8HZK7_9EURY|nr:hypothetical protein [Halolamina pelagica]KPN29779.1 hypothetical protein SY89_00497 [Halolamina pelagica]
MDPRTHLPGRSCRGGAAPSDASCWRARVLAIVLTLLLVSSGVGAAAEFPAFQTGDVETDRVVLEAAVDENGDARWSIEYRVALDDQNTTEAFESLQQDIEQNTSDYRGQFASRMESTVAAAENATGREMAVENVTVEARTSPLSGEYGIIRYSFDWVGFAAVSEGQIAAGDALAGLFLDADTELTISWPDGYVVNVVDPEPDREGENSVTWTGPASSTLASHRSCSVRKAGPRRWARSSASCCSPAPASSGTTAASRRRGLARRRRAVPRSVPSQPR